MIKQLRLLLVLAAGAGISACHSSSNLSLRGLSVRQAESAASQSSMLTDHLSLGKAFLDAGVLSRAVEEFRLALRDPDTLAEASNGLGITYARLGRDDLAERYFRIATAMAPEDLRFAANLRRFYVTGQRLAATAEADVGPASSLPVSSDAKAADQAGGGRIERLSRNEVRIHTSPPAQAPTTRVMVATGAKANRTAPAAAAGYPLRLSLVRPSAPPWVSPPSSTDHRKVIYPLRIALVRQ